MPFFKRLSLLFVCGIASLASHGEGNASEFVVVSSAVSPRVEYAINRSKNDLVIKLKVGSLPGASGETLQLGVAGEKSLLLSGSQAKTEEAAGARCYTFKVPSNQLWKGKQSRQEVRLAFAIDWEGGPNGVPRQREVFRQTAGRASRFELSKNPSDWETIDLAEWDRANADRRQQIAFDFQQPLSGKATVVIEDAQRRRIRNLVSGQAFEAGLHRVVWDGCDDEGRVVPPGKYAWRSISHPGITPDYLFSFCNAPGSNHGTFHAAATNGQHVFLGTPVSEGGYQVVTLKPDGAFVHGSNAPLGVGLDRIALAANDKYLFAAYDGPAWGDRVDRSKPDWKASQKISLVRFDIATGKPVDFSSKERFVVQREYDLGPGSSGQRSEHSVLAGLVFLNEKLYLAERAGNAVTEVDPATGRSLRSWSLDNPVALAAAHGRLYAIAGKNELLKIDPISGASECIARLNGKPAGLAVGSDGRFYVSDAETHTVQVFNTNGAPDGVIGKPGGFHAGPYDSLRLNHPSGLVQGPNGWLWVTEKDRWKPKRYAAYDVRERAMVLEFFGPTAYGAPGASFDPADPTRWIGLNTLFYVDFSKQSATPLAVQGGETGMHYRFWRQEGRTFVIASGPSTSIQEMLPDGRLRPLAIIASARKYGNQRNWDLPEAFREALKQAFPDRNYTPDEKKNLPVGLAMLWVDQNGDGAMQTPEIEFPDPLKISFPGAYWGNDFHNLTLRIPVLVNGKSVLMALEPEGWWPAGAPRYPSFIAAASKGTPIDLHPSAHAGTTVDRFGTVVINSDPVMKAFGPDGQLRWSYPNRWTEVHGSHKAPLPSVGELQGVLFFTGVAPLDAESDVIAMNGNHGRLFLMTSDGLYLDEMFRDVRLTSTQAFSDPAILGGECFGGSFGRSEKDGAYYFQGGGIAYRIYRVNGLDKAVRSAGTLAVSAEQTMAAERAIIRKQSEKGSVRSVIPRRTIPPVIDGKGSDWAGNPVVNWTMEGGRFRVIVKSAIDKENLYLYYTVNDDSPWINRGSDWQTLFKTGDGIDLQLGTNAHANPSRTIPAPGDLRLFVAPFEEGNVAVLYRHRLPGAKESVLFQSPWRSEKVDSVKKLENAKIAVERGANLYHVEVAVPLADLGLEVGHVEAVRRGDFGVIYGDAEGKVNILRNYWSNKATGLVNDVPGEIMLAPNAWGEVIFEGSIE